MPSLTNVNLTSYAFLYRDNVTITGSIRVIRFSRIDIGALQRFFPVIEPWFPIYDPYILGDNCEIESAETCYNNVVRDDDVTRYYLAIRDAYSTKALANTRVLALAGMTQLSLELWHESLSKQTMSENPIDMYLYGDVLLSRMMDASMVPRLMELTKYTRPSRLHFVYGTFKREGFKELLDWMIANRNKGYFVNLKAFHGTSTTSSRV